MPPARIVPNERAFRLDTYKTARLARDHGETVALLFRVAMSVAIDLASMRSLSIIKVKSLKRYLAEEAPDKPRPSNRRT